MRDASSPLVKILMVEDNPGDARLVQVLLAEVGGFDLVWKQDLREAAAWLESNLPDAALLDLSLPDSHGLPTIDAMRKLAPDLPIIVFTGLNDEAVGIAAVKRGCQDYLVKGQGDGQLIGRTLTYAVERKAIERERA